MAAESRGSILGFVLGYVASAGRIGQVVTLDVAEQHRRRGIGRALLEELVRRFEAEPVGQIRLEVDVANETAIAFYESFGFQKKRRLPDYYGSGRSAWEMSLGTRV